MADSRPPFSTCAPLGSRWLPPGFVGAIMTHEGHPDVLAIAERDASGEWKHRGCVELIDASTTRVRASWLALCARAWDLHRAEQVSP
jgi:hypothetical protein